MQRNERKLKNEKKLQIKKEMPFTFLTIQRRIELKIIIITR